MAFGAPYPVRLSRALGGHRRGIDCTKGCVPLCREGGEHWDRLQQTHRHRLFGGEGFIMTPSPGTAGSSTLEEPAHTGIFSPGTVARWTPVAWWGFGDRRFRHIQFVGGVKSALFGGEGPFFATLRGPGRVCLQSLPFSRMADRIVRAAKRRARRGLGSQPAGKNKCSTATIDKRGGGRRIRRSWVDSNRVLARDFPDHTSRQGTS